MDNGFCNISIKEKKYKSGTHKSLTNLGVHLYRTHKHEYKFADKNKKSNNVDLISMSDKTLAQSLNKFLKVNDLKTRNSTVVQAYQVVFSIPKDCFNNPELIKKFQEKVLEFVNTNEIFKDNCLALVYHGDETQPHIQGVFVPRCEGKLNFKKLLGGSDGRKKLSKLHDDFSEALKPLGFKRGDGTHTNDLTYKDYMKSVSKLNEPTPPPAKLHPVTEAGWLNKSVVIEEQEKNIEILKKENQNLKREIKKLDFYKSQNDKLRIVNSKLKKIKNDLGEKKMKLDNEKLENLRAINCCDVLENLNYEVKKEGITSRVKTDDLNLVINSQNKFTENKSMVQGGGAIDMLVKVFKYSFKEAVGYLSATFGYESTTRVIKSNERHSEAVIQSAVKTSNLAMPIPKPQNLNKIIDYLTNTRKIDKDLVQDLVNRNLLFADSKNNCIFTNENNTFAYVRGTYEGKRFVGIKGKIDFIKYDFEEEKNKNLFIFESAIEALSYRTLNPDKSGLYIVTNGSALINEVHKIADNFQNVYCCFNNDDQGKKFCDKILAETISNVVIEKPNSKDFNDDLKNEPKSPEEKRIKVNKI